MGGELSQRGGELRAGKKAGKMATGNSGGDFLKTGKWNTPIVSATLIDYKLIRLYHHVYTVYSRFK